MSYPQKRADVYIKTLLCLAVLLFGYSLCAGNDKVYLNQDSTDKLFCTEADCFFPGKVPVDSDLYIKDQVSWGKNKNLVLHTKGNIVFEKGGKILVKRKGSIILKSGMVPGERYVYDATVKFEGGIDQIKILGEGNVIIYYNPLRGKEKHKYHNPTIYNDYFSKLEPETYRLVNDVYDLQGIIGCLYGSYALSQDIDASSTKEWNEGKGFTPIKNIKDGGPFSGVFDGNNHVIKNLYINRPEEDMVGLFSDVTGVNEYRSLLKDFTVDNAYINGKRCVGIIVGQATGVEISNVEVDNSMVYSSTDDFNKIGGCVLVNKHKSISSNSTFLYKNGIRQEDNNKLFGSCVRCEGDNVNEKGAR